MARSPARRRPDLPRERRLERRARPRRGGADARRGAGERRDYDGGDRRVRARARPRRRDRGSRAAGAPPFGRGLGADAERRGARRDRAARAGTKPRRRGRRSPTSTGPRCSSASGSRRYLDLEHRHGDGAARRGARARRALRASVRHAAREHPHLALALLPAPARLRGRARGRRARARARRVDAAMRTRSARPTSRRR